MNENLHRVIAEIKKSLTAKHNFVDAMPEHNDIVDSAITATTPEVTNVQPIMEPLIKDITPIIEQPITITEPVIQSTLPIEPTAFVQPIIENTNVVIEPIINNQPVIETVAPIVEPIIQSVAPVETNIVAEPIINVSTPTTNVITPLLPIVTAVEVVQPIINTEITPIVEPVSLIIPEIVTINESELQNINVYPMEMTVPTLEATNAPIIDTLPSLGTIAEHVPYVENVDLTPTIKICVVDSSKAMIGRISPRGLAKLESHFTVEASLNEMQDETPTATEKPIITEHPDNVVHGLKEISESKVLSFEAMMIGGLIKPTDRSDYIINTANHSEENLAQQINNNDISKIASAFSLDDHKVLEFPIKDDLQAKIDAYKSRLKAAKSQEVSVQKIVDVPTPATPTIENKVPQSIDVIPIYEEQKAL